MNLRPLLNDSTKEKPRAYPSKTGEYNKILPIKWIRPLSIYGKKKRVLEVPKGRF